MKDNNFFYLLIVLVVYFPLNKPMDFLNQEFPEIPLLQCAPEQNVTSNVQKTTTPIHNQEEQSEEFLKWVSLSMIKKFTLCNECHKVYTQKHKFYQHLYKEEQRKTKLNKKFPCPEKNCLRIFDTYNGLSVHRSKAHCSSIPRMCPFCSYKPRRPGQLKMHILTHTKESEYYYLCEYCEKFLTIQKGNYESHKMRCKYRV